MSVEDGIQRAIKTVIAQHDESDVHHPIAVLKELQGRVNAFLKRASDDPLLLAYDIRDWMPYVMADIFKINDWSKVILDKDDPSIPSSGAL